MFGILCKVHVSELYLDEVSNASKKKLIFLKPSFLPLEQTP